MTLVRDWIEAEGRFGWIERVEPMNISERLERMARAADEINSECNAIISGALRSGFPLEHHETVRTLGAFFTNAAGVLRAGIDPSEPLREENIRG